MDGAFPGPSRAVLDAVGDGSEGVLQPVTMLIAMIDRTTRTDVDRNSGNRVIKEKRAWRATTT